MKRTRASLTVVPVPPYCAPSTTPQPHPPRQYTVHNGMRLPQLIAANELTLISPRSSSSSNTNKIIHFRDSNELCIIVINLIRLYLYLYL
ncbi:hypothetical protein BDZ89DRAFT_1057221 [Hymenopellis radicata]|nr:hypothetical protein BDZ89DRAFT_1057221 [Hymenopellis radicata]